MGGRLIRSESDHLSLVKQNVWPYSLLRFESILVGIP